MSATRDFLLDELGDPDAPIGSKPWALWLHNEIRTTYYDKQQKGERLRVLVDMFKTRQSWQKFGYLTWEDYCIERLHVKADDIDTEAKRRVSDMAKEAIPLSNHGGDRKNQSDNCQIDLETVRVSALASNAIPLDEIGGSRTKGKRKLTEEAGNDPAYLTARIARDRPDILERMKAGEYSSVRSAAIDAGIVDPGKTPYQLPKDPKKAARYLAKRVDTEWFILMSDEFYKQMEVAKLPA